MPVPALSFKALKSGLDSGSELMPGESRREFAQLQAEYLTRFVPRSPEERFQVDNLIRNEWLLRRLFRVETQLWDYHVLRAESGPGLELGEAFTTANAFFMRLQRRITAAEKAYKEAAAELNRLQKSDAPTPAASPQSPSPEPGTPSYQPPIPNPGQPTSGCQPPIAGPHRHSANPAPNP